MFNRTKYYRFCVGAVFAMGVLDDLKKEAQALAAEKARETSEQAAAVERAREHLQPRMQKLLEYFTELKSHLELLNREILASYEVRGAGRVDALLQGDYRIATERPERIEKFSFRYVCAKDGAFQVNQGDAAAVSAYRDYLRDHGLQAKVRDTGRGSALFMVQAAVPVLVEFSADYERVAIRLRVRNLTSLGVTRHTLTLEQVDERFMDELARAILRAENRFDELVGASISPSSKKRLKKQIQAAMRRKEIQEQLKERKTEKESTITHRLGRSLFRRKSD